jgi:predicted NBD/HSP70 family sugar kinase
VVDLTGTTRERVELDVDPTGTGLVGDLVGAVDRARAGRDTLRYVQLGVPGAYDPGTDRIHHVDVPGLDRPGLVGELRARVGVPVGVDNDANLAAVAERRRGVAAGTDSFALLWFGEGLGLAIDLGGTLLRGARGGAGEIGYVPVGVGTAQRDLQDLLGGPAVVALARQYGIVAGSPGDAVRQAALTSPAMVAELADRIAVGLTAVVAVLDPPLVVLAGEVGQAGGTALRDAVAAATRGASSLSTEIATTSITEDAVLLGALEAGLAAVREELISTLMTGRAARETPTAPSRGVPQ